MLHISIIQNNFLNKNLSTLCVQKLGFKCVCVFDLVSGQNASLIDKMGILPIRLIQTDKVLYSECPGYVWSAKVIDFLSTH